MARSKTSRQQTFSITAPKALSVQLVGDFTRWQEEAIEMDRHKGGVWKTRAMCRANPIDGDDAVRLVV